MIILYFTLAVTGILGGLVMIAADFHWPGGFAILAGVTSLCLGVRNYRAAKIDSPKHIDAASDGSGFTVRYGDYLSPILVCEDPWRLARGHQLSLALRASPGADVTESQPVGLKNATGLCEDDFVYYECQLPATPANVLALRATRFVWTEAAERLAMRVAPSAEAVDTVRQMMAELARQDVAAHQHFQDLVARLSEAEPGSDEARSLAAELRKSFDGRD